MKTTPKPTTPTRLPAHTPFHSSGMLLSGLHVPDPHLPECGYCGRYCLQGGRFCSDECWKEWRYHTPTVRLEALEAYEVKHDRRRRRRDIVDLFREAGMV